MEINPDILEKFIIDSIPLNTIKTWLIKKQKKTLQNQSKEDNLLDEIVSKSLYENLIIYL